MYLSDYRTQCHSLLHLGLWLATCPVKPQKSDFLSPTQKTRTRVNKKMGIKFCFDAHVSVLCCHLQNEAFARLAVCKHWVVVIVVKDGDEGSACGAAGWGASILNYNN